MRHFTLRKRRRGLDLGDLRRLIPVSADYGLDRGTPIDRYYVDDFLGRRAGDVRGRALEINDDRYTRRFGGDRVETTDILFAGEGNADATIVADLADAPHIPGGSFDCAILTQTLMYIYDVRAAIATLHRILAPGGVVLASVPGVSKITGPEDAIWGDWWRFTGRSIGRLFAESFGESGVDVQVYGNVLAAAAQLYGLAAEDLTPAELDHRDPSYEVLLCVRAEKLSRD
jgi:SAM-dependent methyltransferase